MIGRELEKVGDDRLGRERKTVLDHVGEENNNNNDNQKEEAKDKRGQWSERARGRVSSRLTPARLWERRRHRVPMTLGTRHVLHRRAGARK